MRSDFSNYFHHVGSRRLQRVRLGNLSHVVFHGLLCFPVSLIFSLGAGAAVAVSSAILVNLSMSPVLLYSFRNSSRTIVGVV